MEIDEPLIVECPICLGYGFVEIKDNMARCTYCGGEGSILRHKRVQDE